MRISSPDRISIVVPTKNEAHNIARLLASVPPEAEVILCDASTDDTIAVALRERPRGTRVVSAPGTIASARQVGAEASAGDVIVFTDADVTFGPDYFEQLMDRSGWDAVYGAKLSDDDFALYYRNVARSQRFVHRWLGIAAASGSNLVIRRSTFGHLGGFRRELSCNEDSELLFRAHRIGWNVQFVPELVVLAHDHRRLRRGRVLKSGHSLLRNVLLYLTCRRASVPRWLSHDWGYWADRDTRPVTPGG